ncbi:hydrophobic surface binding protein A domain-containing protein [Trichoderma novae-zelandiae]
MGVCEWLSWGRGGRGYINKHWRCPRCCELSWSLPRCFFAIPLSTREQKTNRLFPSYTSLIHTQFLNTNNTQRKMHLRLTLLSLLPTILLTTAHPSPPDPNPNPILTALTSISAHTTALNTTVSSWTGSPLTLLAITAQSASLLASIRAGTRAASRAASRAANLTLDQTLAVASATIALATDVNQTVTAIIGAKPKFDGLLVADPVVVLNLQLERDAAREFGDEVVVKVPVDLQGVARGLTAGIDESFAEGLAAYEVL